MKIAVVHNIEHDGVINHFGRTNREMYYRDEIDAVMGALKKSRSQVQEFDGDKLLLPKLEDFFSTSGKGKRISDLVFNLAYGIQGNSRYTHIPAMLEMAGVAYTGSGPLAHSIALDKEMTKRVLIQAGLPTSRFGVVSRISDIERLKNLKLNYPLIIKPRDEAASFGISVVDNEDGLAKNIRSTIAEFHQPIVVEEFLAGREFNVALLGNDATLEVLEPVEIDFNGSKDRFQSFNGKKSGSYSHCCPTDIPSDLCRKLKDIASKAFRLLRCNDYARVDFRLDANSEPYILEINSMAAIHRHGSYFYAAKKAGYDYQEMLDKMIDSALDRYNFS